MLKFLPQFLKEQRQRTAEARRKLSPADVKDLTMLDTGNAELANQIENELLMQEAAQTGGKNA
jgi:hypothetical protein